jgi:hypothetical protein
MNNKDKSDQKENIERGAFWQSSPTIYDKDISVLTTYLTNKAISNLRKQLILL